MGRLGGAELVRQTGPSWAFCALSGSPGARRYYDDLRKRGNDHDAALRDIGNRLVGILDGCLPHRCAYHENLASGHRSASQAE